MNIVETGFVVAFVSGISVVIGLFIGAMVDLAETRPTRPTRATREETAHGSRTK